MYEYNAEVIRVIDGDTVKLRIDLGCYVHIIETCRLARIDAPEMTGPRAKEERPLALEAKEFVVNFGLQFNNQLFIKTFLDKKGKYGRLVVDVFSPAGGECLNDLLVRKGLAIYKDQ